VCKPSLPPSLPSCVWKCDGRDWWGGAGFGGGVELDDCFLIWRRGVVCEQGGREGRRAEESEGFCSIRRMMG